MKINITELITALSLLVSAISGLIATLKGRQAQRRREGLEAVVRAIEEADAKEAKRIVSSMMARGEISPQSAREILKAIEALEKPENPTGNN